MASDRIGIKAAELVAVPPFEVRAITTNFILAQPTVAENIRNVPLNKPLVDSILREGIKNPHLCMKSWYPIAGSQRIRAVAHIRDNIDENYNLNITVHRFLEDYHNVYYLWSDKEFRDKAIAIWFQMQEVVFKSLYYPHEADGQGTKMTDFEDLGEKLKWEHDRSNNSNDSDPDDNSVGC
tara:strand:- start:699 stop:1238 length:540 start_codon:yes stop_codon:yes gene_type:complete